MRQSHTAKGQSLKWPTLFSWTYRCNNQSFGNTVCSKTYATYLFQKRKSHSPHHRIHMLLKMQCNFKFLVIIQQHTLTRLKYISIQMNLCKWHWGGGKAFNLQLLELVEWLSKKLSMRQSLCEELSGQPINVVTAG